MVGCGMNGGFTTGNWVKGLAEWTEGNTAYLSIAFSWRLPDAYTKACWYRAQGYTVRAGGPGTFTRPDYLAEVAEIGGDLPDAVARHNPMATFASRGCPVGCSFCIAWMIEGKEQTLLPDFPVRPVLCDNNLSALPADYQDHIVARYKAEEVPLLDANSGFEPQTFDSEVYARWKPILKGPWRFGFDEENEAEAVERVMSMLKDEDQRNKRVYVMIGDEPFDVCMDRISRVIGWGGEPHVQPKMKLNAIRKKYQVRHDWTYRKLVDVARWVNSFGFKSYPFSEYRRSMKKRVANPDQMEFAA